MSKKSSSKEQEILERQRRLAAQLGLGPPKTTASTATKRPSVQRKSPTALLEAARAKAIASSLKESEPATSNATSSTTPQPSPKIVKKPPGSSKISYLAQIVSNVTSANAQAMEGGSTLPQFEPEDFWKNLRDWDFTWYYHHTIHQQQYQQQNTKEQDMEDVIHMHKPLPNVFISARHYISAWAPLQLAECRAQLLQEALQNNVTAPILVETQSTSSRARASQVIQQGGFMEDHDTATYIQIMLPKKSNASSYTPNLNFFAHDLCLLLPMEHKDLLKQIASNKLDSIPRNTTCIVGHTEVSRRELEGLVLKVSKRKWAKIGQRKMYLVKLGGNITALREFTALCRVELLPLRRYLLGEHLEREENRRKLSRHQSPEQLMEQIGGKQALGKGFNDYAIKKFNQSQLTAIAASSNQYGDGGFTLIKGPPGTGKTTTLVAVLNALHIRQYNKYYEQVRQLAVQVAGAKKNALDSARRCKPRLLICAPSNAAIDNIILKIMEDGFIDGQGNRYNPSMVRVGVGQSNAVHAVSLENKVDAILAENNDDGALDSSITGYKVELSRITSDIAKLRRRAHAITSACPWPLSRDWEIRIDETSFDETGRVFFVNHREKKTSYEVPPPPEPGESHFPATSMPEYRSYLSRIVKLVENSFSVRTHLEQCAIIRRHFDGTNLHETKLDLETHVINTSHMVMTTLGTAGNRVLEAADKFEVVVVDEAAQSVEPSILSALQLGSRHAVLVGDPQQLPATIFNVTGRNSKYDRSLFQRLEEAGQPVYMLNQQYRMHPKISHFPRHIFYEGYLLDGPNVLEAQYGNPLRQIICSQLPRIQPFTILDLASKEERNGTSLSNESEAYLALYMFQKLREVSHGLSVKTKVAVISPYAQQIKMLRRLFAEQLGPDHGQLVEINTVDGFQGREASIVIFTAVRADGSHGIGFLSDIRRMNVALTRAKHFLFVIAHCDSIVVNPYWKDLVTHARSNSAVLTVHKRMGMFPNSFEDIEQWPVENISSADPLPSLSYSSIPIDPRKRKRPD